MQSILPDIKGVSVWMGRNHEFLAASPQTASLFGYSSVDGLLGDRPGDIHCAAAECAEDFISQNNLVMQTGKMIRIFDIHPYADGNVHMLLGVKKPLRSKTGTVQGVICETLALDTENLALILSALGFSSGLKQQISLIDAGLDAVSLSSREKDCLYHLIRGCTIKLTARKLNISPRTVESYINRLKIKWGCHTKAELIEKAHNLNFLPHFLASSLYEKNLSLILS